MKNKKVLLEQNETIKKLQKKLDWENIAEELRLNDQFDKDDTLICAFPRINVPTATTLLKTKIDRQAKFRAQYDQ